MTSRSTELLVFGYIATHYDIVIPTEIIKLCVMFFNEELCWILDINELISMESRQYITGEAIEYNEDLSFHCKVYSSSKGFRKIRLHLLSMSKRIKYCVASSILYCDEIASYSRQVYKYYGDSNKSKHSIRIRVTKYKDLKQLTIRCNIYSMEVKYNNNETIYYPFDRRIIFQKHLNFEWDVDKLLIDSFKTYHCGASYFSPEFSHWNILCTPNGATSRVQGKFQIGIQIIKWPKRISFIDFEFIVKGTYDDAAREYSKRFKITDNETEFYCAKNTFNLCLLNEKLTFHVFINMIKIYDEESNVIPSHNWINYGII